MDIKEITKNINDSLGISELNALQQQAAETAIPKGQGLQILAPTGTGKTLAFALPLLRDLHPGEKAVILAPSRELAAQIYEVVRPIARGLKTTLVTGGRSVEDEKNSLSVAPDIIVATPGRLLDHLNREHISLDSTAILVVDEYDKALELGFEQEMRRLAHHMPKIRETIFTSATKMPEIPDYLPVREVKTLQSGKKTEKPRIIISRLDSPTPDKLETLGGLLDSFPSPERTIVFVNHRESAERVYDWLKKRGYAAGLYHGGLEQNDRENALERLTNGTYSVLVSTDLGARGVDLAGGVDNVVHYHLPPSPEAWTHRNGRTARIGADGKVFLIVSEHDNLPDNVTWDRQGCAQPCGGSRNPEFQTLYFTLGKKEKISRGDILGFLSAAGIDASKVGRIALREHSALAAVPVGELPDFKGQKLKGKAVRVTKMN